MRRILLGLALLIGSVAHASTNVTITVSGPTGGDLAICSDAAGTTCGSFTAVSDASGGLTFYVLPGCVIGPYTITVSSPNSSLTADTATLNVVAGPLVRLLVTSGKNATVPIKGGSTSIAVAGGDACNNVLPLP